MLSAETLVKHTACLRYIDRNGHQQVERQAGWSARSATTKAWRRARSLRLSGEALAFRIVHTERAYDGGDVQPVNDPFAIPSAA